jgi:hypothetical protein
MTRIMPGLAPGILFWGGNDHTSWPGIAFEERRRFARL